MKPLKNRWLVSLLLLFFLLEGGLFPWLLPVPRAEGFAMMPRLVMTGILYLAMMRSRNLGLACGLAFGFLQDVVYDSPMLGVHGFSMAAAAYAAGTAGMRVKAGIVLPFAILALGLAANELIVFALYRLFQIMDMALSDFLVRQLAPTLLLNLLLAVALFVPARKWLVHAPDKREEETA